MRHFVVPGLVLMLFGSFSSAQSSQKSEKREPSAILASARFVYVEPYEGGAPPEDGDHVGNGQDTLSDPRVTPEDLEAVTNVLDAIQKWGYYTVTIHRNEADLILLVRKGRVPRAYVGVHAGNIPPGSDPPSTRRPQPEVGVIAGSDAGPNVDIFWVYSLTPQRKLFGPLWSKELKNGLSKPGMVLFEDFKNEVTTAAAQQSTKH